MMRNRLQSGVGHVALVLVVLVFGAIGAIGYTLYAHPGDPETDNTKSVAGSGQGTEQATLNVPTAPAISTASDLDKAEAVLSEVDPGANGQSDSAQLDAELNSL
jgi:hypothetical protein